MSDIQLTVLFVALAGMIFYVRGGMARESGASGVLERKPALAADDPGMGLRRLLLGHLCSLALCIPFLAQAPFSLEDGHAAERWIVEFISGWLLWAGLLQLAYAGPLWWTLRRGGRNAAARGLALGAGVTVSVTGLAWAARLRSRFGAPLSLQAFSSLLALACAVALVWLARELRRALSRD